jgi:FkbM family methyltransferase
MYLLLTCAAFVSVYYFRMNPIMELSNVSITGPRQPRKIFVDLGANCGNTYWRMKLNLTHSGENTLTTPDWEAYLFECNPQMINWFLNDLIANETRAHRKVELIPKAASTTNGEVSFFLTSGQDSIESMPNTQCDPNSGYNPSGASTIYSTAGRAGTKLTVPSIHFLEWHKALQLQANDIVHMKMDIEGAEMDILNEFLDRDETNQICYWELFWNEYHKTIFQPDTTEFKQHEQFENTFPERFQQKCGRPLLPNVVG